MITIHLQNLNFYSYHGVHEEEKILGNEYVVNADIRFHEDEPEIRLLAATINYVDVFEIIKSRMKVPTPLLETVVMEIGNAIYERYNYVRYIHVSLTKVHPPIVSIRGAVAVSWHKEF